MLIYEHFGIIKILQTSPIPQTSFLIWTFFTASYSKTAQAKTMWPYCAELACTACTADYYVHGGNQAFDLDRKCRSEMKMKIYSSVDVKISSRELALASSPYSQT